MKEEAASGGATARMSLICCSFSKPTRSSKSSINFGQQPQVVDTHDTRLLEGQGQRSARPVDTNLERDEGVCERMKFGIDSDSATCCV